MKTKHLTGPPITLRREVLERLNLAYPKIDSRKEKELAAVRAALAKEK